MSKQDRCLAQITRNKIYKQGAKDYRNGEMYPPYNLAGIKERCLWAAGYNDAKSQYLQLHSI